MKKIFLFLFSGIVFIVASCNGDNINSTNGKLNVENQKIYDDIMATHDEVMPKMSDLNEDKQKLRDLNDKITEKNIPLKDTVLNTILVLSKLEDDMSDWMSNFKTSDVLNNADSSHTYLVNQKKIIAELNDNVKKGLNVSSVLLKKN